MWALCRCQSKMNIPTADEWIFNPKDLDESWSYREYLGKSKEEAKRMYRKNALECSFELGYMSNIPFAYYATAFKDYVSEIGDADEFLAHQAYMSLVINMLKRSNFEIKDLLPEMLPLAFEIAENQEKYDLDFDIFGNLLEELESAIKAHESTF